MWEVSEGYGYSHHFLTVHRDGMTITTCHIPEGSDYILSAGTKYNEWTNIVHLRTYPEIEEIITTCKILIQPINIFKSNHVLQK